MARNRVSKSELKKGLAMMNKMNKQYPKAARLGILTPFKRMRKRWKWCRNYYTPNDMWEGINRFKENPYLATPKRSRKSKCASCPPRREYNFRKRR